MRRRTLLVSLGSSTTAGCAGLVELDGESQDSPGDGSQNDRRRIVLGESDDVPESAAVTIDIEQLSSMVTTDEIPRFRVTTTNLDQRKYISIRPGRDCCLFNRAKAASSPSGFWFFHRAVAVGRDRGERWTAEGGFDDYGCVPRRYDPEESITNGYRIWDDARTDGYMVPGDYRFEAAVSVIGPDEETQIAEFTWGFTVHVKQS